MNIELLQVLNLLIKYKKSLGKLDDKFADPEYLAWVSMLDKNQWPQKGEFVKARTDPDFREFRSVYKDLRTAMKPLRWGVLPERTRMDYQAQFVRETGGVPF